MKVMYRSKRQEAIRKGLLKKLFAKARARGLSDDELRGAILAEAKRKPRPGIILKNFNYKKVEKKNKSGVRPSDKSGVRPATGVSVSDPDLCDPDLWTVSLSSLRIWQLNQVDMAIFPEEKEKRKFEVRSLKGESEKEERKFEVRSLKGESEKKERKFEVGSLKFEVKNENKKSRTNLDEEKENSNVIEFEDWHKGDGDEIK